jgi:diguanylate cyclase (GGDEF)-like protein
MPNLDLSIMVVDDTKFSSTIIAKTLNKAGYRDVRIANDANSALAMLEARQASVMIADWLMPDIDGLQLTAKVRQLDEKNNHFTYVMLLTAKEGNSALNEAFDKGIDDFIFKSEMSKQLLPRVYAADRMSERQNTLLAANQLLMENNKLIENKNIVDVETGIGNHRYARDTLDNYLKHIESREGAISYMLIEVKNWKKLTQEQNHMTCEELALCITRRLRSLIRPMDTLCRIAEHQYAIIANFGDIEHCSISSYRRIHDGLNSKSFRTTSGYFSIHIATCICTIADNSPVPTVNDIEEGCQQHIRQAIETDTIVISRWKSEADITV